jgi:branched-chain amino acid transport system substrate-binding protein
MKIKNSGKIGVAIVAIVLLSALALSSPQGEDKVKIGYIGPLTGDVAVLGIDASKAIELAVEEANSNGGINGKQIQLIIEDDQYSASKTLTAYNKLVHQDGVDNIIISTYGGLFAIAEKSYEDNVLVIDSLDCDDQIADLPENVFCIAKETKDLADVIGEFAIDQGYENIGVLHGTVDQFMPLVAKRFKETVESEGLTATLDDYTPGTLDFKTQLLKFRDSDALVFLGYDEIGIAIRQAEELGLNMPFLTIPSVATTPSIQEISQGAIDGTFFSFYAPLDENNEAAEFYKEFEEKNGRKPYVFVASDHAYDAANILINEVLPGVNGQTREESLEQKMNSLYKLKNYDGVSGTLSMDSDGRIQGILIRLYQLENLVPKYISG